MDCEAEATIAWSYYKFQNGLMMMPKIIPHGDKSIYEYTKPPKMNRPFIKLSNDVLKKLAKRGYDPSYYDRIHPESFEKYVDFVIGLKKKSIVSMILIEIVQILIVVVHLIVKEVLLHFMVVVNQVFLILKELNYLHQNLDISK